MSSTPTCSYRRVDRKRALQVFYEICSYAYLNIDEISRRGPVYVNKKVALVAGVTFATICATTLRKFSPHTMTNPHFDH